LGEILHFIQDDKCGRRSTCPTNYLLVAKKFRNLWRRIREISPPPLRRLKIFRNKVAAARFLMVGVGPAHRASLKSSACPLRPEIERDVPIRHKKYGRGRKEDELRR